MSIVDRRHAHEQLQSQQFDVVVVGGGISGAWIARYLSDAGLAVALLERGDFAGETSSASSKLLHGGIRYLQQLQFARVRESSLERAEYLAAAPHLANAIPFVVPTYGDLKRGKLFLTCGMFVYRLLGIGQRRLLSRAGVSMPATKSISKRELSQIAAIGEPGQTGAVVFPEFHLYDSERTVWAVIQTAIADGAIAVNYSNVNHLVYEDSRIVGVNVSMEGIDDDVVVRSRLVINAAGPWVDQLNSTVRMFGDKLREVKPSDDSLGLINGYAIGAHVITRQLVADRALAITTKQKSGAHVDRGGRHIFIIPWRGCSLIGTSYRETVSPDAVEDLDREDLEQLLAAIHDSLPAFNLTHEDIVSAYSGLYPLRVENIKSNVYQGTGEYLILDHAVEDDTEGLITALGAKFTTARTLGERTSRLAKKKLGLESDAMHETSSSAQRLSCADYHELDRFMDDIHLKYKNRFDENTITHLARCYGSDISEFIEFLTRNASDSRMERRIIDSQPDLYGQVFWSVRHEMALHLEDYLYRRSSIGLLGLDDKGLSAIAQIMATELSWSSEQTEREISQVKDRQQVVEDCARSVLGK